jgi:L-seryl-tRNA(Ser) seleniumtransferase
MPNEKPQPFTSLRDFPSVEILSQHPALESYFPVLPRPLVVESLRKVIAALKEQFAQGRKAVTESALMDAVAAELDRLLLYHLVPVINGTGIIIHTNLGRAPISRDMMVRAQDAVCGYSNLEFDLHSGRRGKRGAMIELLLSALCETESGTLVNNNAAALFIILNTLAARHEVIVSRGELVQIGGGFRIPDIMVRSGVRLVEVGTTNRTTAADYAGAVTDRTRMILKVHPSNFVQQGFVEDTPLAELAALCREKSLILTHDLGSGLIGLPPGIPIKNEPRVHDSVRAGADLTCFSGDKLLGGVQAGLIVGRTDLIAKIKKNPLYRTIRCDKLVFAITAQVLSAYLNGTQFEDIPVWRMIAMPVTALKSRAEAIVRACPGKDIAPVAADAYLGGGSTPGEAIPSLALSIRSSINAGALAVRFRKYNPPIIGRVEENHFLLDLRTIPPDQDSLLIEAIKSILE